VADATAPRSSNAGLYLEVSAAGAGLLDLAGDYLTVREAEHSFLLGRLRSLRDHPDRPTDAYLAIVRDAEAVHLVAVHAPPDHLVLSLAERPDVVDLVVADVLTRPERPSGVMGPVDVVRRFVATWEAAGGPQASLVLRTRTYRLDEVISPAQPPEGAARTAVRGDVTTVGPWVVAFVAEALPHEPPGEASEEVVTRWMEDPGRIVWLWEAGGLPVSMAVAGNRTPNGRRIGMVYTPPEHRRRGYAGSLVAAASQSELDTGRSFCVLDTDRANPTSNHVYKAIGYRAVVDGESYAFAPG
jgi:predicted GNAT family acetyltransferase